MALAAEAGVPVGVYEYGVPGHPGKHIHAHLDVFVNGKPYTGDPAALVLKNLHEIAIAIGTPPSKIPSSYF